MTDANAAAEITYLSVADLAARYLEKSLSPREALAAVLERIDSFNGAVNAFRFVDRVGAMAAAEASEARWMKGEPLGPLDGVPASVKDILMVKGWSTTYGSSVLAETGPSREDAPAVARLREAGAILLGMTNTPEIGWKGVTDSPAGGGLRAGHGGAAYRHRRRRVDPYPLGVHRPVRHQGELRAGTRIPGQRLRHAGPYRAADPVRRGRGPDAECGVPAGRKGLVLAAL
jgi:hypothetical protein